MPLRDRRGRSAAGAHQDEEPAGHGGGGAGRHEAPHLRGSRGWGRRGGITRSCSEESKAEVDWGTGAGSLGAGEAEAGERGGTLGDSKGRVGWGLQGRVHRPPFPPLPPPLHGGRRGEGTGEGYGARPSLGRVSAINASQLS